MDRRSQSGEMQAQLTYRRRQQQSHSEQATLPNNMGEPSNDPNPRILAQAHQSGSTNVPVFQTGQQYASGTNNSNAGLRIATSNEQARIHTTSITAGSESRSGPIVPHGHGWNNEQRPEGRQPQQANPASANETRAPAARMSSLGRQSHDENTAAPVRRRNPFENSFADFIRSRSDINSSGQASPPIAIPGNADHQIARSTRPGNLIPLQAHSPAAGFSEKDKRDWAEFIATSLRAKVLHDRAKEEAEISKWNHAQKKANDEREN